MGPISTPEEDELYDLKQMAERALGVSTIDLKLITVTDEL